MIAADKVYVKKMILIEPGYNLTEAFWYGDGTRNLKNIMAMNKITLNKLYKIWKNISPNYYFRNKAKNTKYLIKMTKKDHIIPYSDEIKLIKFLNEKKIDFEIKYYHVFSHGGNCILESLFPKKTLSFFNN